MKWNNFFHQEEVYELAHLHPFEWHFTAEAADKRPDRTYKFHVTFSMHCFTRDPSLTRRLILICGTKDQMKIGYFVFIVIHYLTNFQILSRAWETESAGILTTATISPSNWLHRKEGVIEYEVYFDVTRASRKGWLNLIVQTAYVRTEDYETTQPKKRRIRLDVVAYNTQLRKPIKRPR